MVWTGADFCVYPAPPRVDRSKQIVFTAERDYEKGEAIEISIIDLSAGMPKETRWKRALPKQEKEIPPHINNASTHIPPRAVVGNRGRRYRLRWAIVAAMLHRSNGRYCSMIGRHNQGISRWTRGKGPWEIVWQSNDMELSAARKLENRLKRQGRGTGFYAITGLRRTGNS